MSQAAEEAQSLGQLINESGLGNAILRVATAALLEPKRKAGAASPAPPRNNTAPYATLSLTFVNVVQVLSACVGENFGT